LVKNHLLEPVVAAFLGGWFVFEGLCARATLPDSYWLRCLLPVHLAFWHSLQIFWGC
jgi:hypothetical protein